MRLHYMQPGNVVVECRSGEASVACFCLGRVWARGRPFKGQSLALIDEADTANLVRVWCSSPSDSRAGTITR